MEDTKESSHPERSNAPIFTRLATKHSTSSGVFKIRSENTSRDKNENFSITTAMPQNKGRCGKLLNLPMLLV